jgi:beta-galactosidase/beta-glucuronidase
MERLRLIFTRKAFLNQSSGQRGSCCGQRSSSTVSIMANVPKARLWNLTINTDIRETNLTRQVLNFTGEAKDITDNSSQRFGFRWFDVREKDGDKRFYLNGKRVFILRL